MTRNLTLLAVALLVGCQSVGPHGGDRPPRVETITQDNQRLRSGWLVVQSSRLLRPVASPPAAADPWVAIRHYEALLALNPDPQTRAEAMRRAAYLRVRIADSGDHEDPAPLLGEAVRLYQRLLAEHPDDLANDLALYQLARAQQLLGEPAAETLITLARDYPASALRADAAFRAGELLYVERRFGEAAEAYERALDAGIEDRLQGLAGYKLGWSRFRDGDDAGAVEAFAALLHQHLPPRETRDAETALASVAAHEREMVTDALRGFSLSMLRAGGAPALDAWLETDAGGARHAAIYYAELGAMMLARERYSDAAAVYTAFGDRHATHALSPDFQRRAIEAYTAGGFDEQARGARENFVTRYAPDAPYWASRTPEPEVIEAWHVQVALLAAHHHALAQDDAEVAHRQQHLQAATHWYRIQLQQLPDDEASAAVRMLYADALLDAGEIAEAALQYEQLAYGERRHTASADAAFASVQAHQQLAAAGAAARSEVVRDAIAASQRLAEHYPQHPQRHRVLVRAAEDAFEIGDDSTAMQIAETLLAEPALDAELRRTATQVVAGSHYANGDFAAAELAYTALLAQMQDRDPRRTEVIEQLASAIYRQGEAERAAGETLLAAGHFERVADVVPGASLRPEADYDAAAMYAAAEDWQRAARAFDRFRLTHETHALHADADKRLADALQRAGEPAAAAAAYARIAARAEESREIRREAAWLAASLYGSLLGEAGADVAARDAYAAYVRDFPRPINRAQEARHTLAQMAHAHDNDAGRALYWQREIVRADAEAGVVSTDYSRLLAAQARLALGRDKAARASALALRAPIERSLPRRQAAVREAIDELSQAAASGYAEVVTAATYELAAVYQQLARDLLSSERPSRLRGEALDEYELLLEDQAYPIEERAIAMHEQNLQRLRSGLWDDWVGRSARALSDLVPGRYGKRERWEDGYASMY
jgi:outer membrane protein assembly factor BamD (BamD/ComL family)